MNATPGRPAGSADRLVAIDAAWGTVQRAATALRDARHLDGEELALTLAHAHLLLEAARTMVESVRLAGLRPDEAGQAPPHSWFG